MEIVFDLFNLLNFLDRDWGHVNIVPDQRDLFATFHSLETDPGSAYYGHPRYIWGKSKPAPWVPDNLASRWQAQLGLRCTF